MIDPVLARRLARYRDHLQRQQRLGFDVRQKMKALAGIEALALNGTLVAPGY